MQTNMNLKESKTKIFISAIDAFRTKKVRCKMPCRQDPCVSNRGDGNIVIFTINLSKSFNLEDFLRTRNGEIDHYSLWLDII